MESLKDLLQHLDEDNFTKYQILNHLEEWIVEVIIGEVHFEIMVMLGLQSVISYHDPNVFIEEDSCSKYSQSVLGMYDSDELHSTPMNFPHDTFLFQFDY